MKKFACMLVVLSTISVLSFTQAFDKSIAMAVGGDLDPCNGSDTTDHINCEQLEVPSAPECNSKYRKVSSPQSTLDVLSTTRNECMPDGCVNVVDNPSPAGKSCTTVVRIGIDPPPFP
jgi:hypothetical protein